jgi:hypothetical protein
MSEYSIEQMKQYLKEDIENWYGEECENLLNDILDNRLEDEHIKQLFYEISGEEDKTLYEEQFEYIKKLLLESKQLGEMNPNLNLKIIISNVMNKYDLSNDDAMKLIGEVISDLD